MYQCQKYPKQNMRDSVKIRKEILKVGCRRSRFLEYAECGHAECGFVKNGNEMNRIITLAYTAIILVAVAVQVCLLNSLKPNKQQTTNSQRAQSKRRPSRTNGQLRVQKTFLSGSFCLGSPRIAQLTSSEELGTM